MTKPLLTIPMLALACACARGGDCPPTLPPPPQIVETRGPCLSRPPPMPNPQLILLADKESLTPEEEQWLWTWIEVLQNRVSRDWQVCGKPKLTAKERDR